MRLFSYSMAALVAGIGLGLAYGALAGAVNACSCGSGTPTARWELELVSVEGDGDVEAVTNLWEGPAHLAGDDEETFIRTEYIGIYGSPVP